MGTRLVTNTLRIRSLAKSPTGSTGVDEITQGGFPESRPASLSGSAGRGTRLPAELLARNAMQFDEPGAFIALAEMRDARLCAGRRAITWVAASGPTGTSASNNPIPRGDRSSH